MYSDKIPVEKRLQYARKAKGYTMSQLADEIGVNKMTVGRWESGKSGMPNSAIIVKIAKALDTTPDFLLGVNSEVKETPVSASHQEIIDLFDKLSPENQKTFLALLKSRATDK